MVKKSYLFLIVIVPILLLAKEDQSLMLQKATIQSTKYFDINRIKSSIRNDGIFARNPINGNADFSFDEEQLIYTSGLWIAAKVNGEIRASAADFNTDWIGGAIDINGIPFGKDDSTFRVYKISRGDDASNNPDYAEWPIALGAPSDGQGNPLLMGDQTLWCTFTDAFTEERIWYNICDPLGAEVHLTVWGWKEIDNVIFLRWEIINKSQDTWNDAYIGIYSDPDVFDASNDLTGSDSTLNLAYCYDGKNWFTDIPFRCVGYHIFESPAIISPGDTAFTFNGLKPGFKNLPIYSPRMEKSSIVPGWSDIPYNEFAAHYIYNRLQCLNFYGEPAIDPITNRPSKWAFSGDPITRTGWIDDLPPRDRRMMLSTGPLNLEPGDSTSIACAIIPVKNDFRLGNVFDVKQNVRALQYALKQGAGIYSVSSTSTLIKQIDKTPIMLLNFNPIKEVQFRVQFDTSEIKYNGLILSERTLSHFFLDSIFVENGTFEYTMKSNGQENLILGNGPIAYLNFEIQEAITKNMIYMHIHHTGCLFENGQRIHLNDTESLVKIEKLPAPPRLLTPSDGEYIDDLTVHFSWTKTEGSDPNSYRFESNLLNKTLEDTCFSYPLINFIKQAQDQAILNWTVKIVNYSQSIPSPDTFQFRFPSSDDLNFAPFLYTCQLPFTPERSERITQIHPDGEFLYIIQSYKASPLFSYLAYHFLIAKIEHTGWNILTEKPINAYGAFAIAGNKAFLTSWKRVETFFIDENKTLRPQTSFELKELIRKIEVHNNLLIIYGGDSNPKIFIYQFNDELTELAKLSELNLNMWHNSVYHVRATWILSDQFIFIFFKESDVVADWGVIDIGDPQSPQIICHLPDTTGVVSFIVQNEKLYTTTENNLMNIYDISDLMNPLLIHSEDLGDKFAINNVIHDDIYATLGKYIYKFHFQPGQNLKFNGLLEIKKLNPIITEGFIYDYSMEDNWINVYKNNAGTGVDFVKGIDRKSFDLSPNYPNPFNPKTTIRFSIDEPSQVSLKIYNIRGQLIKTLIDDFRESGRHKIIWDGTNSRNQPVASGLYFFQFNSGDQVITKKMLLLK